MSTDFEKVSILDDRLHCTDKINYGVIKGGQNITSAQFNAVSATPNQINWNVQIPSQEVIIAREMYISAQITLQITVPAPDAGHFPNFANTVRLMYGKTDAFAPFPLHQLIQTQTTTINNNSITQNTKDILPAILRMLDPHELQKHRTWAASNSNK